MREPTLVIMAAGMGSRFGGLKQITAVDAEGHAIIDFSLFDAYRAGFRNIAFIIKHEIEDSFKAAIGSRMEKYFDVKYVYQQLDVLPEGYSVPEGREKPWGTGHAVMCCRGIVDEPFAVINADDFYGAGAYKAMYEFLNGDRKPGEYAMVGYRLRNTVTENGSVARGVCDIENGYLVDITERTHIEKRGEDAAFTEDGETFVPLSGDATVSMNFWGFSTMMLDELYARFPAFLDKNLPLNPLKCEYFLPFVANEQLREGLATVRILDCNETWYGMTYHEDVAAVKDSFKKMLEKGVYKADLFADL